MKTAVWSLGLTIALFASTEAKAQTLPYGVTASVPFEFRMAGSVMPAGDYSIRTIAPGVIRVSCESCGAVAALVHVNAAERGRDVPGQLVFHAYANRYFLANVWAPGQARGVALQQTKLEKELAANAPIVDKTVISARVR